MTMMTATQALSVNPATGQTLAAMPWANAQEIEHALSLAASGFKKWKMTSVAQRAQTLRDIGQRFALMQKRWRNVLRVKWVNP